MLPAVPEPTPIKFTIRSYEPRDALACRRLYEEGLIGGKIAENDTGADIDHIPNAYMSSGGGSHFFVAEKDAGEIVGMIGVQQHVPEEGEIRRLRVSADCRRRGIGSALLERAIRFCKERQHLKVTLDTFIDREPALRLFEKFGFKHTRTRDVSGKSLLYFYLDLYAGEREAPKRVKEKS
jgi:ribosomal protein S18 acetylase RimI-like enzyme